MDKSLKLLYSGNAVNVFADYLFIPLFALFAKQTSGSVQLVGILFGTQYAASTLTSLVATRFEDAPQKAYNLLRLNYCIKAAAWLALCLSPHTATLIFSQAVIGIAAGIGIPAFQSVISANLNKTRHIANWSSWQVITNLATVAGTFASGFILASIGFRYLFLIMALVEISTFVYFNKPSVRQSLISPVSAVAH
jgi:MFS family permease